MNDDLRVVAFVYDFPHGKSVQGLLQLKLARPSEVLVLAAPRVVIPGSPSPTRETAVLHPRRIAEALGYEYSVEPHGRSVNKLREYRPDCGFVLGARILPHDILDLGFPIVNLHPGVLPENRGLDSPLWAVLNDLPQGVTAHLLGDWIDGGPILEVRLLEHEELVGRSFESVRTQLTNLENRLLQEILLLCREGVRGRGVEFAKDQLGTYHSRLTPEAAQQATNLLPDYIVRYPEIVTAWTAARGNLLGRLTSSDF